jgi:hypothetical protein
MALINRTSLCPGLLWLTLNPALIIQCILRKDIFFFFFQFYILHNMFSRTPYDIFIYRREYACLRLKTTVPIDIGKGSTGRSFFFFAQSIWIRILQPFQSSLIRRDVTPLYTLSCLAVVYITFTVAWALISYAERIAYPQPSYTKAQAGICWVLHLCFFSSLGNASCCNST